MKPASILLAFGTKREKLKFHKTDFQRASLCEVFFALIFFFSNQKDLFLYSEKLRVLAYFYSMA